MSKQFFFDTKVGQLVLIYFLILIGFILSRGFFTVGGAWIIFLATVLFTVLLLRSFKKKSTVDILFVEQFLAFIALFSVAFSLILYGGLYQIKGNVFEVSRLLLFVALFLTILYIFPRTKSFLFLTKWKFSGLILIALLLRILMIISSPTPYIDTFYLQKLGSLGLLSGKNPYQMIFPQLYPGVTPDYFSYGPGVLLLVAPASRIFGDPRVTHVLAEIAGAILLYFAIKKTTFFKKGQNLFAELIPIIFLFNPMSLYILEQSYLDPIIIFFFILFVHLYLKKSTYWSFFALSFVISIKQTMIIVPLFLLKQLRFSIKKWFTLIIFPIVLVTVFFIWSPIDFWNDLIHFYLIYPIRHDGLTINSLFFYYFGYDIPTFIFIILWTLGFLIIFRLKRDSLADIFLGMSFWFLIFYFFNKLAFVNYYYFVCSLLLISIALTDKSIPVFKRHR
jgi:hypothetical protein